MLEESFLAKARGGRGQCATKFLRSAPNYMRLFQAEVRWFPCMAHTTRCFVAGLDFDEGLKLVSGRCFSGLERLPIDPSPTRSGGYGLTRIGLLPDSKLLILSPTFSEPKL